MNKHTLALALGTVFTLGSAVTTSAVADTIKKNYTLPTADISVEQFSKLFRPLENAPAISQPYQFVGSPATGTIRSQVFGGVGEAEGKYAYAYQISVNEREKPGDSMYVDSLSYKFNDTPLATNYVGGEKDVYAYTVTGSPINGLFSPADSSGEMVQKPASVSWMTTGEVSGALRVHFVDPDTETPPLEAGANSAAFVVISDAALPSTGDIVTELVNLQSDSPTTGTDPEVYAASGGNISPVPVPEPSTVLAWAGMIGALAVVRRVRKNRPSA